MADNAASDPLRACSATLVPVREILPWREGYRRETQGQIVHDSLHSREGWTQSYQLRLGATVVGYGAAAVAGPWKGTRTIFEFYVAAEYRPHAFDLFETLVTSAGITAFEVQTNDTLLTIMLPLWCLDATNDKIVFRDAGPTSLPVPAGVIFRRATPGDLVRIFPHQAEPVGDWVLEIDRTIVATGGILFHYNPPHGDLYFEVAAPFQRRGLGRYLLQELKRVCREGGKIPCARCKPQNLASRRAIQNAGFAPCSHVLTGRLVRPTDVIASAQPRASASSPP